MLCVFRFYLDCQIRIINLDQDSFHLIVQKIVIKINKKVKHLSLREICFTIYVLAG